jgi:hypothetical protein
MATLRASIRAIAVKTRPAGEQVRRHEFKKKFKPHYDSFRALPLGAALRIKAP